MRMVDLIEKKRDGLALTDEEIRFVIDGFTNGSIPDYQMSAFAMAVFFKGMTDHETAVLTDAMMRSGDTIDLSRFGDKSVDKHSTGGVGDKTTLILAPIVSCPGGKMAKMSGRGLGHTGGTVDKLEAIPGTPRVQLVIGDGLSSAAIMANAMDCLEAIREGLKLRGIEPGKPIFVRYCRVGAGDAIGDITGCELVCMLVGERPGLVTDKSMSAYITYRPHTGVSESSRTVVSNIHAQGTPAVEAGAHIAGLLETILQKKRSGVALNLEAGA